jgi:hypothetical protein
MRSLSKAILVLVGLLAIGSLTSPVRANDILVGTFTLAHPTQWKGTLLPAGDYRFKLSRTQSDSNILKVQGKGETLDIFVFAQSACNTCRKGALTVDLEGDNRVVTSLELPGFHVDFNSNSSGRQSAKQMNKGQSNSEQVSVQVDQN